MKILSSQITKTYEVLTWVYLGILRLKLGELYSDVVDVILEECLENMRKWNSYPIDADCADIEFELPENFPKLSSL
ncbi:hypothetical protein [Anabaena sp. CA = ATCC 33047]|uniref:hypothetical protein n=1 Tax=Anabaena sp. (strain CA / ATCC 33047) TaxID=52271 RepID=UPI00082F4F17|nr:hypothetical protein [Anabaena sp. CA = ATCC 33047]